MQRHAYVRLIVVTTCLMLGGAACGRPAAEEPSAGPASTASAQPAGGCQPVTAGEREVPGQTPAFSGQTRACAASSNTRYDVTVVARGLESPWAVEPLPTGEFLVSEKPGRLRIVTSDGTVGAPIAGFTTKVDARGQGGLLDVALSPSFDTDRTIYWSFTEPRPGGNGTSVARGVLSRDRARLETVEIIVHTTPTYDGDMHFGSRLAFGPDGMLYVTLGERSDAPMRPQAQLRSSHLGKVLRLTPDGGPAPDNPFTNDASALPGIYSLGHRNIQAAAFDDQGRFWVVEHGTKGGDELNLIEAGKNYGWPLVAFGEEYSGSPIEGAQTTRADYVDPVYYWDPVIAPSGAQFYSGSAFPDWRGNLFVGALKQKRLVRLVLENGKVVGEEHLLADRGHRIRDVRQGPDGALYVTTDDKSGELWKIAPRQP